MNGRKIFLTGGSGLVGGRLLRALSRIEGLEVVALDRSGSLSDRPDVPPTRIVRGNLLEPDSYAEALRGCDCILHLAAATGKAAPAVHDRDTALGTEVLVGACLATGVERFLLVSSIAAAFPDKSGYPYAVAKHRAERAVAMSGLRYCILRPTMILGEGAPVLASLTTLALLPLVLVPGSGKVRVQPISVDDVVRSIIGILRHDRFQSETFEVGGPEILTMEALLRRVRVARKGTSGTAFRIPLGLIQAPLALAEQLGLRSVLPATAGQLSSFRHDGVATPNAVQRELAPDLKSVESMIVAAQPRDASTEPVEMECIVFTRHLLGMDPDRRVLQSYRASLVSIPALSPSGAWELSLLTMARRGVPGARCADAFAAVFARASVLRKRLVVLLAILETTPPYSDRIDKALGGPSLLVIARVALRSFWSLLYLLAGTLLLVPLRIAHGVRGESAR